MYEAKDREKNCETVEEFIERYEYPKEAKRILREFESDKTYFEDYDKEVAFVRDTRIFVSKIMDVNGVTLQCLTMMQKDKLSLYVFLAGDGFFYQPYISGSYDEYYLDSANNVVDSAEEADHIEVWYGNELFDQMHVNAGGEFCIPIIDEETGDIAQKNIGRTTKRRDFRKHNVFENIIWALQNSEIDRDSVDMSEYTAPGIYVLRECFCNRVGISK